MRTTVLGSQALLRDGSRCLPRRSYWGVRGQKGD